MLGDQVESCRQIDQLPLFKNTEEMPHIAVTEFISSA